jgi:hypothetical protein
MARHRNPRARLPKRPTSDNLLHPESQRPEPEPDVDQLFGVLRDNLGKADAFISSAEYLLEQAPSDDEQLRRRRRSHIEHLVEAGKLAVRAAANTTDVIDQRRRG